MRVDGSGWDYNYNYTLLHGIRSSWDLDTALGSHLVGKERPGEPGGLARRGEERPGEVRWWM